MSDANEARVRRAAARLGWRIVKSRARRLHCDNRGLWQLIDDRNTVVGGDKFAASLSDCDHWIEVESRRLAA